MDPLNLRDIPPFRGKNLLEVGSLIILQIMAKMTFRSTSIEWPSHGLADQLELRINQSLGSLENTIQPLAPNIPPTPRQREMFASST